MNPFCDNCSMNTYLRRLRSACSSRSIGQREVCIGVYIKFSGIPACSMPADTHLFHVFFESTLIQATLKCFSFQWLSIWGESLSSDLVRNVSFTSKQKAVDSITLVVVLYNVYYSYFTSEMS